VLITIPIKPTALPRTRFVGRHCYNPVKSNVHKTTLQWYFKKQISKPFWVPLHVKMTFSFLKASKVKDNLAKYPAKTPDIDNIIKMIFDSGNGVAWVDDCLIVSMEAKKIYGLTEQIEIEIT
jgi:Holliday junction resolvase RusA-like endonuclease